ncbi:angio-associated migratory cell protein-like [Lytechinus variegatus]|uniref:angio-associated migratory cell protein-like n=1 Tax=Lytechinus variegatus TaxID=7654 RepID=UPI001BB2506B|nr:angio-associated migratory cell protein-like [Lytechinus variegatus]XP_041478066.1 angio-associated migratory cell protein-like [Lytechinus variegatus]
MDPNGNDGQDSDLDEGIELYDDDNDIPADNIANEMDDMDFYDYDELEDEGDDDEGRGVDEEGAMAAEAPRDDAITRFESHSGAVFCCDIHPAGGCLAVTGGEDDKAYIWNTTTGESVLECTGHNDSVTCVCFSYDGELVATGDMSGVIKVWKLADKDEIWTYECSDLEWLTWHSGANVLLGGTVEGSVWMWKIPSGDCKMMQGHGCHLTCGKIFPDGKRCCVGYKDGSVKVWDLKQTNTVHHFKDGNGHEGDVTTLDCNHDNILALSGSIDGTAKLLNSNTGKVLATFSGGAIKEDIGETNSVESVGFSPSQSLAALGSLNGMLSIWDIPTQKLRHQCDHGAGIVRLAWDVETPMIFTAGLDGMVKLWDSRSAEKVASWTGHQGEILDLAISRDGNTIVTASGDTSARVFKVQQPDR